MIPTCSIALPDVQESDTKGANSSNAAQYKIKNLLYKSVVVFSMQYKNPLTNSNNPPPAHPF